MTHENFPPNDAPEMAPTETAKEKFERERLTRRQALKRFGMTSAMATFALFSVDDLARMVGGAMERQARNSKIATQVAKEFQHSGIALGAEPYYGYYNPGPTSDPPLYYAYYASAPAPMPTDCTNNPYTVNCEKCQTALDKACLSRHYSGICYASQLACETQCDDSAPDGKKLYDCWKNRNSL